MRNRRHGEFTEPSISLRKNAKLVVILRSDKLLGHSLCITVVYSCLEWSVFKIFVINNAKCIEFDA